MTGKTKTLQSSDIAVITPTKGRHKQLSCLLKTLQEQSSPVGQIIIADGGRDAADVVGAFEGALPVFWLDCPNPGQVIQRNLALTHLDQNIRVVVYFDDDIQLQANAVEAFVAFWNEQEIEPAGVSFNLTNMPNQPDSFFRHLFYMGSRPKGKVLASGYNTPAVGVEENLSSEWLIGGATGWRRDVLMEHKNPDLTSRWAITEDLMFSYPVHKAGGKLHVCAQAKGLHIDDTVSDTFAMGVFRGRSAVLWRYMFVTSHEELSLTKFYWMTLGLMIGRCLQAMTGRLSHFGFAWGYAKGVGCCIRSVITGRDIRDFVV